MEERLRRRGSTSSEELDENGIQRYFGQLDISRTRSSEDRLGLPPSHFNESHSTLSAAHLSPLWGEPGRKLPSVSSMLQLPPPALAPQTSSSAGAFSDDIEDFGKEDKQREGLLIEELAKASPRVRVEVSASDRLCPRCKRPECQVSKPPPGYYSALEVARHRSPGDCWIMAHGFVYDCSRYIAKHPGGPRTILNRAGMDASQDFDFHTRTGKNVWKRLQVGRVAQCTGPRAMIEGGPQQIQDGDQCTIS